MPDDPYVYPGTPVLKNRLGLRDPKALAEFENERTFARLLELLAQPEPGRYDLLHLQRVHARVFIDVYPWAGQIRTVAIAKGELFALPQHIVSYATTIFAGLIDEAWLRPLDRRTFVERLAFYFGEINALHPFRDGNGRTQRAFLKQLARDANRDIWWRRWTIEENLAVSRAAMSGDNAYVVSAFDRIVP